MSSYKVSINTRQVTQATEQSFKDTALLFDRTMKQVFRDPVFNWPVGDSPRDIIDTGNLAGSQNLNFEDANTAVYTWNVEYAPYVHFGYVTTGGTDMPARPWTTIAQQRLNIPNVYAQLFKRFT